MINLETIRLKLFLADPSNRMVCLIVQAPHFLSPFLLLQGQHQDLHGRKHGEHMGISDPTFLPFRLQFSLLFNVADRRSSSQNALDLGVFVNLIHWLKWRNKAPREQTMVHRLSTYGEKPTGSGMGHIKICTGCISALCKS